MDGKNGWQLRHLQKITCKKLQVTNPPKNPRRGRQQGETHSGARLTDHEVELVRHLHEIEGWGYKRIAKKMDSPKRTIRDICKYRYR